MVANVWMCILPNQRRIIAASLAGQEPDWAKGAAAKQRSLHNSYITIPVLITMLSNHFSFVFDHQRKDLILAALCVVGACVRHLMIDRGEQTAYSVLGPIVLSLSYVVFLTIPTTIPPDHTPPVAFAEVNAILSVQRCHSC